MQQIFSTLGYYLTHPAAVIYVIATALFYPAVLALLILLLYVVFEAGRFTIEWFRRRGRRRLDVQALAKTAQESRDKEGFAKAVEQMSVFSTSTLWPLLQSEISGVSDLTRNRALKALADAELYATKRLEGTRLLIRVGPLLGLMTTLIPISPALVALAKGDVETLSRELVIAFSTTVVGLLIGGIAYTITTVRDRWYQQDIVDVEYVLDGMVI